MYVDLEPIIDCLDDQKDDFIFNCRRDIKNEVARRGRASLAINEVGVRTHFAAPDNYIKVLWKFRNGDLYHGHRLESVLSEPISDLVVKHFNNFLTDHKPDVEAQLKKQVAASVDLPAMLEKIIYDNLRKQGVKQIRHHAADAFIHGCQSAFHSHLAQTTSSAVTHSVTTSVGTAVGTSIAHALTVAIAHAIGTAMIHLAHSVAFKAVLKTIILHSVGAIVTAVLVKMIATHMTAASAGACLGPLVWTAGGAYLFYKIVTIPDTLGEELGQALAAKMRGEFRPWTETALEECFKNITDPTEMLKSVVKAAMDTFLPELMSEMTDMSSALPAYESVEEDVKRFVDYGEDAGGVAGMTKSVEEDLKIIFVDYGEDAGGVADMTKSVEEDLKIIFVDYGEYAGGAADMTKSVEEDVKKFVDYGEDAGGVADMTQKHNASTSQTEIQVAARDSHPAPKQRAFVDICVEIGGTEDANDQKMFSSSDDPAHQEHKTSKAKNQSQGACKDILAPRDSFLSKILKEIWERMIAHLTILRESSSVWERIILCLIFIPVLYGFAASISTWDMTAPQVINASRVATSQEQLTIVMDRIGQNLELARDMVNHDFAVRDLIIRVEGSNLSRKTKLAFELDAMTRHTKQTAKDMSRLKAEVSKSIDKIKTFDNNAINTLKRIVKQRQHPILLHRILSTLSPFAAFRSVDTLQEKTKTLLNETALNIHNEIKSLLHEFLEVDHKHGNFEKALGKIRDLAFEKSDGVPRKHVLATLWARLAQPDDHGKYKSHKLLLKEMNQFPDRSADSMTDTIAALDGVEVELSEIRKALATPESMLREDPLEVIGALRRSAQRLKAKKK